MRPSFIFYPSTHSRARTIIVLSEHSESLVMRISQVSSSAFEFVQRVMKTRQGDAP
jgi:hypothetical protein